MNDIATHQRLQNVGDMRMRGGLAGPSRLITQGQAWLTRNLLQPKRDENDELSHDSTLGVKVLSPSSTSNATLCTLYENGLLKENSRRLWDSECGKNRAPGPGSFAPPLLCCTRSTRPSFELPWASVAGKSRGYWIEKLRVAALVAAAAARVLP